MAIEPMQLIINFKNKAAAGIKSVNNDLKRMDAQGKKTAQSISNLRNSLVAVGGVLAGGAFLKSSLSVFASFDDNMRTAGAVTNATTEELKMMTEVAKKMGQETRYTAAQSAEALKFLGMAGLSAAEATAALPDVLNLAAAGAMDLGQAADIATNVLSAFGLEVNQLSQVNNVLAKTFTSANVNLIEIGEAFKMVGPIARGVGSDFEDLVASIGGLGNAGIKGTMAGTALKNALDALLAPTKKEAALFKEFAQRIGQSSLEVKDSKGNFVGFVRILEQLEKAGIRGDEALQAFGMRAGPALSALLNQGSDKLKKLRTDLREVGDEAGRIKDVMEGGLGGELRRTSAAIESVKLRFGEAMEDETIEFLQHFQELLKSINKIITQMEKDGTFAAWGKAAVTALDLIPPAASKAYTAISSFTAINQALFFGVTGDTVAAKAALQDFTDNVNKTFGTYKSNAEGVSSVTKEITKEMLATRQGAKEFKAIGNGMSEATKEAEKFRKVVVGIRSDGSEIVMVEKVMSKVTTEVKASTEQIQQFQKESKKAYQDAKKYAQEYAEKVVEYENQIRESKRSTDSTIRELGRKGLTDEQQWSDRKKEAEENLTAAKKALREQDYKSAKEFADRATSLYASLAQEVSSDAGGKTVVTKSLENTKKIAIEGVKEVGNFNEQMLTEQKNNAEKSQKTWEATVTEIEKQLTDLARDREANVSITLNDLTEARAEIAKLTASETKTIYVKTIQTNQNGGLIYGFNTGAYIPRKGKLTGYGGGDKIKALLEPGEGILRKEAMNIIGESQLNDWNALKFNLGGAVPSFKSTDVPAVSGLNSSGPSETLILRFQAGENEASVNVSDTDSKLSLKSFVQELEKMRLTNVT